MLQSPVPIERQPLINSIHTINHLPPVASTRTAFNSVKVGGKGFLKNLSKLNNKEPFVKFKIEKLLETNFPREYKLKVICLALTNCG